MLTDKQKQQIDSIMPPNFSFQEMIEGTKPVIASHITKIFYDDLTYPVALKVVILAWRIQRVRDVFGSSIFISNSFRSKSYEVSKRRSPSGTHPQGLAADIYSPTNNKGLGELLEDWNGGLGTYKWGFHVDMGAVRRW